MEYVKPAWAIDMSKFSRVAISRNTQAHYYIRSKCLAIFSGIYGNLISKRFCNSRLAEVMAGMHNDKIAR